MLNCCFSPCYQVYGSSSEEGFPVSVSPEEKRREKTATKSTTTVPAFGGEKKVKKDNKNKTC